MEFFIKYAFEEFKCVCESNREEVWIEEVYFNGVNIFSWIDDVLIRTKNPSRRTQTLVEYLQEKCQEKYEQENRERLESY